VFAVGDMTSLDGLPGVAEVAMQGSLHAAHTIGRRLRGLEDAKPFRYRDLGSVATIGRFRAIVSWHGIRLSGLPAWLVWAFVHLAFLNGYASRFTTLLRWTRWLAGSNRVERAFSVAHTGGDLSAPEAVREQIMPTPFPEINASRQPPDHPS
jgi:NADH dehydrogenase